MLGWAVFGAIGAAALFAQFLPQLSGLVPKLGDVVVFCGAEIADALVAVGSLTFDACPCCVTFNDCGGQIPAQQAGFLPNGVVDSAGVTLFVPDFRDVGRGALGSDCFIGGSRPAEWWSFSTPCGSVVPV
ncbi:hypothetical protein [Cryobacterium sp. TMT2-42-4]|uniref:hypothetical protein n=1 Tax=Cryobacterium sp. TMT2-42-4 TaxID=1259255 RepID=UPI0010693945|nr:hypothetical protein [Cryobacterium sp. TMT2-42-4]TFC32315.1 hypothetical protein E3O18_15930 [Cryobacterium sp. TMT2-42-4]